jgi:hypothetical protein
MSAITNVWRQLVQRRLWPVAIVLIAGLAAVPLLLAQEPEPTASAPAPAPAGGADDDALIGQPIVAKVTATSDRKRRKVIGASKNPFGLPPEADNGSAAAANVDGGVVTQTGDDTKGTDGSTGGGTAPSTPVAPSTPIAPSTPVTPSEPKPAPKRYAVQELTVRFGTADGVARQSLKRLQPLPSAEEPVLIYMGVLKDGKTAVFMVDHGVEPVGDGECRPTPEQCETIRLKEGETEFLDVKDETGNIVNQYQLDLIKIHKGSTASAAKASASSKAGARLIKSRPAAAAYKWNAETGTLEPRRGVLRSTVGRTAARLP